LVGAIYDTALDRSLWPAALRQTAVFVQGLGASVYWHDAAAKSGDVYLEDGGIAPYWRDLYFAKYVKLDPTLTRNFFAVTGEPLATADLLPYTEFLQTRFYLEWARPQGLVDFVSATLEKSATSAAMFGVFRHERNGVADEETRQRMRLIAPHIQRAVLISKVIDFKQDEAAMMADTLDRFAAAIILLDAGGGIVHSNAAGHRMLAARGILRASNGRLASGTAELDATLGEAISASAEGDAALGTKGIAIPLTAPNGERHVAHVLPLTSGLRGEAGRSHSAAAAVFVHRAEIEAPSPPEVMAKAFKLTPTELRVLLAVVEVGGVPEVAEALGVAETTVKWHLGHVFAKTGTSRQVDLVKLVAGYASPLTE
jgi:DNA-binding CsgD family transcriptional regulator